MSLEISWLWAAYLPSNQNNVWDLNTRNWNSSDRIENSSINKIWTEQNVPQSTGQIREQVATELLYDLNAWWNTLNKINSTWTVWSNIDIKI